MALKAQQIDESKLWHLRLDHFNFLTLKVFRQKKMVQGLPFIKEKTGCF